SQVVGTNANPVVRNRANSGVLTTLSGVFTNGYNPADVAWQYQFHYVPFVKYMLGVVVAAYRDFSDRVETLVTSGLSKPERVAELIRNTYGEITKSQIMEKCPDISRITVERALSELLSSESIIKIGGGRYTKYVWNRDKE
ncbi:MAG: hypothetical protein K5888_11060, partial [Lachnospiraceae bacterium]|nr:hypothetical protein [Lachnospiraceae bacterium]